MAIIIFAAGSTWAQSPQATESPGGGVTQSDLAAGLRVTKIAVPESLLRQYKVYQGGTSEPRIALTFDDGPNPDFTLRTLELLARYGARATFFLVGKRIDAYPELARAIVDAGHEVANHTYSHPNLAKLTSQEALQELDLANQALERATGLRTYLFRPPGGNYTTGLVQDLAKAGYLTVLWTANTADYSQPGVTEISRVILQGARPGAIILAHTGAAQTLESLPYVLEALRQKGFRFVTVGELLGLN